MNNKKIKICFIVPSLEKGGSEKNISFVMNVLSKNGYLVECIIIYGGRIDYNIDHKIQIHKLFKKKAILSIKVISNILKRRKYDVVFSNMPYINVLNFAIWFLLRCRSYSYVCRESILISKYLQNEIKNKIIWKFMLSLAYRNSSYVIAQCEEMKNDILQFSRISEDKIKIIGNSINTISNRFTKENKSETINLLSIGRLVYQKGFDILLDSINNIKEEKIILNIIGDGEEKDKLYKYTLENNLDSKVQIHGHTNTIDLFYEKAIIFCTTSRYEGFPNVVLEALSHGLFVCATPSVTGISEIQKYNPKAVHVSNSNDAKDYAICLMTLIKNLENYRSTKINLDNWNPNKIENDYLSLFKKLSNE